MSTISVCLITKNEIEYLSRWLGNVSCFADEIIIVDTGSTDGSLELINKYPRVRVEHFLWSDDFAAARNFSLSLASMDWVLVLDADEHIPEYRQLQALLNQDDVQGYYLRIRNFQPEDSMTLFEDTYMIRLFRNNPDFTYKGIIQEEIVDSIKEKEGTLPMLNEPCIHHDGYRSDIVQGNDSRRLRNIRLLHKALEQEPNNVYYLYQLGLFHKTLNPPMLENYLLKALQQGEDDIGVGIREQIHMRLSQYYLDYNQISQTIHHAEQCLLCNPNNLVAHSCVIIPLIQEGRLDEALPYIDFIVENGEGILSNWQDIQRLGEICRAELQRVRPQ